MSVPKTLPLTTVSIRVGAELPTLCVACGQTTSETARIVRTKSEGGQAWPIKALVFLMSPFLYATQQRELHGKQRELELVLPFCSACAADGKEPCPTFTNFDQHEYTFIVHDAFAKAFRAG